MNQTSSQQNKNYGSDAGGDTLTAEKIDIAGVRSQLKGRVITPDDPAYDHARTIFYGGINRRPAIIARVADAEDVRRIVSLAQETGLELAIRSGGHSAAGFALTEGGIVLDLHDMCSLQIDPENHNAWAETGLTAGEYTTAVDAYGLATGFGDTGTVGIGGLTLGGGVGYLSRKHGLTIDSLLAAEIVTADGHLRYVDSQNEPDLFWAIRGGGGNFGVATRFKYSLHEVGKVLGGMLVLPATPEVIDGFISAAEAAPTELSTIANIMPAPPMPFLPAELHGKLILLAMMVYAGSIERGLEGVAPFRKLAKPYADMLRPIRYPEMFPPEEGGYHPTAVGHTLFLDGVNLDSAKVIMEYLQASNAPMRVAQLRVLGGAVSQVQNDATAYAHRHRPIMANLAAFYTSNEDREVRQAWLMDFSASLGQKEPGAYVNFLAAEGEERVRNAYPGATWKRLAAIKAQYDPTNLFRLNQNIKPLE